MVVGFRTKSLALIADAFHYVHHTRPVFYNAADWSIAE
jgi:Co/Zn/Cd efflux system component